MSLRHPVVELPNSYRFAIRKIVCSRLIGSLIFIRHFPQKWPIFSGSLWKMSSSRLMKSAPSQMPLKTQRYTSEIRQIQKLNFFGTHSNETNIHNLNIWICTARYQERWVCRFGGFGGCSNFRENSNNGLSRLFWAWRVHFSRYNFSIWICTARYWERWVSRFGGFRGSSNFRRNSHNAMSRLFWAWRVHFWRFEQTFSQQSARVT